MRDRFPFSAMARRYQKKRCLLLLIIAMSCVLLALVPTLEKREGMLTLKVQNGVQAVSEFYEGLPEIIRAVSRRNASLPETNGNNFPEFATENKTQRTPPDRTDYWARKLYDVYEVPDPFSSQIGPDNVTFPNKYIIYRCDRHNMKRCGGWADRVKAMITTYLLANMTGRVFKAENIMPDCDFRRFLVPNHVNWSLPLSFHRKVSAGGQVAIFDMVAKTNLYYNFPNIDWLHHPTLAADFVYMKGNHDNADNFREYRLYPESLRWMHSQDRVSVNRVLFKRLFKPSDHLRQKLINFLSDNVESDEKLICAHLRMGKNPTMPEDFRVSLKEENLSKVWALIKQLMAQYGNKTKIFLMSDSDRAIAEGQRQAFKDKVFVSPGRILHVELSRNVTAREKCDGLEKVIFEQQVLLHCDSLVITSSGIGRMAAYLRGRDDGLYCLLTTNDRLLPCRPIDLKTKQFFNTIN